MIRNSARTSHRRVLTAVAAVGLLLAACAGGAGSTGSSSSPSPQRPTSPVSSVPVTTGSPKASPTAPVTPTWKAIARAPIAGRIAEGLVWTGSKMIVWGGLYRGPQGTYKEVTDGAIYEPATGSWRKTAAAPSGLRVAVGVASAWTGTNAVFWAGNAPDAPSVALSYSPASNTWKSLPAGPLGNRESFTWAWIGTKLLIVGGTSGDGFASPVSAALNPKTGGWTQSAPLNALKAFIPNDAIWNGRRVFITGAHYLCPEQGSGCTRFKNMFVAYDPASDTMKQFDLSRAPVDPGERGKLSPIGWVGTEVALQVRGEPSTGLVLFDPVTGAWRTGARPPAAVASDQWAWLGDRYVLPATTGRLEIYDVANDAWTVIQAGTSPLSTRNESAIAWTGKDLIVWSGYTGARYNPTPNTGMYIRLGS